jgi:pimeloyl-ACP methyl ester carboxylesterase
VIDRVSASTTLRQTDLADVSVTGQNLLPDRLPRPRPVHRIHRHGDRPKPRAEVPKEKTPTWQTRQAQYDAVCTWGIPDHARLERLRGIDIPVFVANGDSDPMILPHFSYLLAGLIPHAQVKIYPDAAHGFLFQHHAAFAADVAAFLDDEAAVDEAAVGA